MRDCPPYGLSDTQLSMRPLRADSNEEDLNRAVVVKGIAPSIFYQNSCIGQRPIYISAPLRGSGIQTDLSGGGC